MPRCLTGGPPGLAQTVSGTKDPAMGPGSQTDKGKMWSQRPEGRKVLGPAGDRPGAAAFLFGAVPEEWG